MAFAKHIWDAGIKDGCGGEVNEYLFGVQLLPHMKKTEACNPVVPTTTY
jgi:hypothetical protein